MRLVSRALSLALCLVCLQAACRRESEIYFFVLVKSSNYAQDSSGTLTLLNYHFFSEIFLRPDAVIRSATLTPVAGAGQSMSYEDRGENYYLEGGHFDTLEELDAVFPNGAFAFDVETPNVHLRGEELQLAGPDGRTDIPAPITISLFQRGEMVTPVAIDPEQDLVIRWSAYSNGSADPRGVVDDMVFVVIADCRGERLFHTGLPFQGEYLTFRATEMPVQAGTLRSGQQHSMFVEFPHVVDSRVFAGTPGFTSYATATYLDLRTTGPSSDTSCPEVAPPMDTGQTDRSDPVERE